MPFDRFLFVGGLQQAGKLLRRNRGHDVYTVSRYSSLEPLFGQCRLIVSVSVNV